MQLSIAHELAHARHASEINDRYNDLSEQELDDYAEQWVRVIEDALGACK